MPITVQAVGLMKKKTAEIELKQHYMDNAARLCQAQGFGKINELEYVENAKQNVAERKALEAKHLLNHIQPSDYVIILDENGKSISSRQFSSTLQDELSQSRHVHFLLGGPDGHGDACLQRANLKLSFGRMTWPHRLARILLYEQIYRAMTIMTNHPYHRD